MPRNRGQRKPTLRDLSRQPLSHDEVIALLQALKNNPPIVTAILGAGLIEHQLDVLVRTRFKKQDDDTWITLTDENGPLGTFHKKIAAGYAFSIYDESWRRNLDVIRAVRNAFAHTRRIIDFEHELIKAEFRRVAISTRMSKADRDDLEIIKAVKTTGRSCYIGLCIIVGMALTNRSRQRIAARRRYAARKSAAWRAANPGLAALVDLFVSTQESKASSQKSSQDRRSVDPSDVTPANKLLAFEGLFGSPPHKTDK